MKPRHNAFTLIELLIVVAIIAILAAIAVPNFLEAQVRAKVSRAKTDMRTIAVGLESYRVDQNHYPRDRTWWQSAESPVNNGDMALTRLTTPVAYLAAVPSNVFPNETDNRLNAPQYRYFAEHWLEVVTEGAGSNPLFVKSTSFVWSLVSTGPNRISNFGEHLIFGKETFEQKYPSYLPSWNAGPAAIYDPSNGSVSVGDIVLLGPGGGFDY
jgi:type II secretion system protein G